MAQGKTSPTLNGTAPWDISWVTLVFTCNVNVKLAAVEKAYKDQRVSSTWKLKCISILIHHLLIVSSVEPQGFWLTEESQDPQAEEILSLRSMETETSSQRV